MTWEPPPISDYGMIGDTRTAALCSAAGSIDWLCLPDFDSDPVFGRLVGGERAGSFSISVDGARPVERRYRQGSTVLETTWRGPSCEVQVVEGMVTELSGSLSPRALLVRRAQCRGGSADLRVCFDPRLGLPGRSPTPSSRRLGALVCSWGSLAVGLSGSAGLEVVPGKTHRLSLRPGEALTLAMSVADQDPLVIVDPSTAWRYLEETDRQWRRWMERVEYLGPASDEVFRSLLTLRMLTFSPSGAPVAAPTTSLPEAMGGPRNWDYRYSWPRDAAIGLFAFLGLGKTEEAHSFMHWLLHASRLTRPRLQVLYTVYGRPGPAEREPTGVPGYRGSLPVRLGNAASAQHQLDVYGWVVEAAWLLVSAGSPLNREAWRAIKGFADVVAELWPEPDAGVWEVRGDPAHHVHSKLMGWVALDRAIRIAQTHPTASKRANRWRQARRTLAAELREQGFDHRRSTYTWRYGSESLDAALVLLPVLDFEEPGSPRLTGTMEAIRRELGAGGPLLYRYPPRADGLAGKEGAFLPCSFWMVRALNRLGRREEATEMFEELCALSNDLGLLPEEIDPTTGEHLGNFPQALTHATLVQAAIELQDNRPGGVSNGA